MVAASLPKSAHEHGGEAHSLVPPRARNDIARLQQQNAPSNKDERGRAIEDNKRLKLRGHAKR